MATKSESEPIQYFVFMKAETTGRPWEDYEKTKIMELSMIAVNRKDLERGEPKKMPAAQKLNMIFCPERYIQEAATDSHELTEDYVQNALPFNKSAGSIVAFLQQLPKPVCLVAHNGGAFDFKHLLMECIDANISLPEDLLCVDAMWVFYYILKDLGHPIKKAVPLLTLYLMLFNEQMELTTAEQNVLCLLDCALDQKEPFLKLADEKRKFFSDVKPVGYPKVKNEVGM